MIRPLCILPLLFFLAASACSTVRQLPSTDSTKVEVRYETKTVHDTAYVELPVIVEKVATLDTLSTRENAYAKSEAAVTAGILRHSLETKPASVPVKVETKLVYKDSIVFRDRVQIQKVEVERTLTQWQSFKMRTGGIALTLLLIIIVTAALYLILRSKNLFKL